MCLIGCVLAQVFWPAAVNTSRKFALGEVWHSAIASELVLYNASNKCALSGSHPLVPSHSCSWDLTASQIHFVALAWCMARCDFSLGKCGTMP